jgi:LAO/AO transport system kinase
LSEKEYERKETEEMIARLLAGDHAAAAKIITQIENAREKRETKELMEQIYPHTGRAWLIGVTGAPGVGKSTLVDRLIALIRSENYSVGVIGVDATSPFSGGALLGDRIRMTSCQGDKYVFIRSMATRGHLGGLSVATQGAVRVLDAMGMDVVLVETVGVGQIELDIMQIVDTVVLVVIPGGGDRIQAMKAGIMEIADIFVVNKSDHEGADSAVSDIKMMQEMNKARGSNDQGVWIPPILKTVATSSSSQDVLPLLEAIRSHRQFLIDQQKFRKKREKHNYHEIVRSLTEEVEREVWKLLEENKEIQLLLQKMMNREMSPYQVSGFILSNFFKLGTGAPTLNEKRRRHEL